MPILKVSAAAAEFDIVLRLCHALRKNLKCFLDFGEVSRIVDTHVLVRAHSFSCLSIVFLAKRTPLRLVPASKETSNSIELPEKGGCFIVGAVTVFSVVKHRRVIKDAESHGCSQRVVVRQ